MKSIIFAVFLLGISLPVTYSRNVHFYRKDYTYNEAFDAFYKVHWDVSGLTWHTAYFACEDEGATLFYPKPREEWTLVKNLTNDMTELPNVTDIFVGFHDDFQLGEFFTVDGQSTPYPLPDKDSSQLPLDNCITMNIDTGSFNVDSCLRPIETPLPFVCKKIDDESCPTVDHGYKYVKTIKKCYKVNKKLQNWQKAMKTCFMEGGILAVVENSAQAQEIKDILEPGDQGYFVGIRKVFSRNAYYSVKGQKFSDLYQRQLSINNFECGTVKNADNIYLYTDADHCDNELPFICEMEVTIKTERRETNSGVADDDFGVNKTED